MDDEIIHSWCFHDVECFDSTPSAAIIILDKYLESFSSLRYQQSGAPVTTNVGRAVSKARGSRYDALNPLEFAWSHVGVEPGEAMGRAAAGWR